MINQTASLSAAFVVGDQKVALPLCPDIKILTATFWNTNNGGKSLHDTCRIFLSASANFLEHQQRRENSMFGIEKSQIRNP